MSGLSGVQVTGPLERYAAGFGAALREAGFGAPSARQQLQMTAQLSRWLAGQGLSGADLSAGAVEEFLRVRRGDRYARLRTHRALEPLLGYLREIGAAPAVLPPEPGSPVARLLEDYRGYLLRERGLAAGTVGLYEKAAGRFLAERSDQIEADLGRLAGGDIIEFVLHACRSSRPGASSMKTLVTALRSLLRFLYLEGWVPTQLAGAVPTVASWRASTLPRGLDVKQVRCLLGSCDPSTAVGSRDLAILTLLARLGLRSCEVSGLMLADLDWRAGEILVCGKGRRVDRMPMPDDVGEAVAGYLHRGRRRCTCRAVFLTACAPRAPLSAGAVRAVVRRACGRAGLPRVGAHRLRHFAATEMLRAGATLPEVSQALRHRDLATTAIYAKVDRAALTMLARPWPGSTP